MIRVAAFTGGVAVPSARFRVRQYIPALLHHGFTVTEMPSRCGVYPPQNKLIRPFWAGATLAEQIPNVIKSHCYDVVLLQREMLSSFATLEWLTGTPRVLDVDDAIFLQRNGGFARRLARISDRVLCGNAYLAEWFSAWNKNIFVIPTAVNTDRYAPVIKQREHEDELIIGWIGTSANLKYVYAVEAALAKAMAIYPKVKLRIVSDKMPLFRRVDMSRCEFIRWSESIEVESIQGMDIGIMPLEDSAWARGKCSYKMLQYMACGIPVVVSPVGMNAEVLSIANSGVGAISMDEWCDAIVSLIEDSALRKKMGVLGRQVAVGSFSVTKVVPQIAACLTF
ncbi:MAG: glycosyltransferase family 4 protein [Methylobacter sp.]|nr:glycosyltransferase family 4 protein [Methylobacter sp.]